MAIGGVGGRAVGARSQCITWVANGESLQRTRRRLCSISGSRKVLFLWVGETGARLEEGG